ncbi:MAG: hypothetical protein KAS32_15615 [Candidatus Peribacteraceae bacterium]|nr:hypothetical protein [Candidatus Peribacteraceae bacterium]
MSIPTINISILCKNQGLITAVLSKLPDKEDDKVNRGYPYMSGQGTLNRDMNPDIYDGYEGDIYYLNVDIKLKSDTYRDNIFASLHGVNGMLNGCISPSTYRTLIDYDDEPIATRKLTEIIEERII